MRTRAYEYSYLPCQFCVGKNHCRRCGAELEASLLALPGVAAAEVDGVAKRLSLTLDGEDFGDIEEKADEMGVFLERDAGRNDR